MVLLSINDAKNSEFFLITVPTPVDKFKVPDLRPIMEAAEFISKVINKGAIGFVKTYCQK